MFYLLQAYPATTAMNLTTSCSNDHTQSGQSPDSGIVMGPASFAGTDSSLSPCGTMDSVTSTSNSSASDVQLARKRSKSLPEMEAPEEAGIEGQTQQDQRPASVKGASKELGSSTSLEESSTSKSSTGSTATKQRNSTSSLQQQQQRQRLYSSPSSAPGMRGTIPLSHTPTSLSKINPSGPQFSVPKMNYSPLHHTSSHSMYAGFPGYQPYNTTSPGMPTQAAYPPTYNNPYTGSSVGSAYMGPSGPSGSAFYNTNSLVHSPSYATQSGMLNYMPYSSNMAADTKQQQGSSLFYNSSSYPYSSVASGGVSSGMPSSSNWSSSNASQGNYSSLSTTSTSSVELSHLAPPTTATSLTSLMSSSQSAPSSSASSALPPSLDSEQQQPQTNGSSVDRPHTRSQQGLTSPLERLVGGCDSTTASAEISGETMEVEASTNGGGDSKNAATEAGHYSTRYVCVRI